MSRHDKRYRSEAMSPPEEEDHTSYSDDVMLTMHSCILHETIFKLDSQLWVGYIWYCFLKQLVSKKAQM